ncbi:MAG: T9SS type A sorting domain-containing protein [candidate division WOR-3 bacterium]
MLWLVTFTTSDVLIEDTGTVDITAVRPAIYKSPSSYMVLADAISGSYIINQNPNYSYNAISLFYQYNSATQVLAYHVYDNDTLKIYLYDVSSTNHNLITNYNIPVSSGSIMSFRFSACGDGFCGVYYTNDGSIKRVYYIYFDNTTYNTYQVGSSMAASYNIDAFIAGNYLGSAYDSLSLIVMYRCAPSNNYIDVYLVGRGGLRDASTITTSSCASYMPDIGFIYFGGPFVYAYFSMRNYVRIYNIAGYNLNLALSYDGSSNEDIRTSISGTSLCIFKNNYSTSTYQISHLNVDPSMTWPSSWQNVSNPINNTFSHQDDGYCYGFSGSTLYIYNKSSSSLDSYSLPIDKNYNWIHQIPFNDNSSQSPNKLHISAFRWTSDSIYIYSYNLPLTSFFINFADSFQIEAPLQTYPNIIKTFSNDIYLSTGISSFFAVRKIDANLNILWRKHTSPYSPLSTPFYIYRYSPPNDTLRYLDRITGSISTAYKLMRGQPYEIIEYSNTILCYPNTSTNELIALMLNPISLTTIDSSNFGNINLYTRCRLRKIGSDYYVLITRTSTPYPYYSADLISYKFGSTPISIVIDNNTNPSVNEYPLDAILTDSRAISITRTSGLNPDTAYIVACNLDLTGCSSSPYKIELTSGTSYHSSYFKGDTLVVVIATSNSSIINFFYINASNNISLIRQDIINGHSISNIVFVNDFYVYGADSTYNVKKLRIARISDGSVIYEDRITNVDQATIIEGPISVGSDLCVYRVYRYTYGIKLLRRYCETFTNNSELISSKLKIKTENSRITIYMNGSANLKLYDLSGRKVYEYEGYVENKKTINVKLNKGIYILKLNNKSYKIIVN